MWFFFHQHRQRKTLTNINQTEKYKRENWCRCGSIKNLWITFRDFPEGLAIRKSKILTLRMGLSKYNAEKVGEVSVVYKKSNIVCYMRRFVWTKGRYQQWWKWNIVSHLRRPRRMNNRVRGKQHQKLNILCRLRNMRWLGSNQIKIPNKSKMTDELIY